MAGKKLSLAMTMLATQINNKKNERPEYAAKYEEDNQIKIAKIRDYQNPIFDESYVIKDWNTVMLCDLWTETGSVNKIIMPSGNAEISDKAAGIDDTDMEGIDMLIAVSFEYLKNKDDNNDSLKRSFSDQHDASVFYEKILSERTYDEFAKRLVDLFAAYKSK